jgi:hypothetical protein
MKEYVAGRGSGPGNSAGDGKSGKIDRGGVS